MILVVHSESVQLINFGIFHPSRKKFTLNGPFSAVNLWGRLRRGFCGKFAEILRKIRGNLQESTSYCVRKGFGKTQKGVDKRGLSPNPVEHKRREKKGFGRESLATQKTLLWTERLQAKRSIVKSRFPPSPTTPQMPSNAFKSRRAL